MKREEVESDKIKVHKLPFVGVNGFVVLSPISDRFHIFINAFDKKNQDLILEHELCHIKIFESLKNEDLYDYSYFSSLLESSFVGSTLGFPNFSEALIRGFLNSIDINRRYESSITEAICKSESYEKAYNDPEKKPEIMNSLNYLKNSMLILYDYKGGFGERFDMAFPIVAKLVNKDVKVLKKYPILKTMFTDDGKIKDCYTIYKDINSDNKEYVDKLLVDLLLIKNNILPDDKDYLDYITNLLNREVNNIVSSLENQKKGLIFVSDEVLRDNRKVLLDRLKKINNYFINNHLQKNSQYVRVL